MELKVWVDGIQRVICGVTNETTCHEVIIALANAMGRTGRFTLIEKWRDVERPLPPNEFPALALQKWGEYASEVRLHLCQSDSDKKKVHREKQSKAVEKFAHNFSVPESTEPSSSIKRSSTFSGAHNLSTAPRSHRDQLASRLQPVSEKPRSSGLYQLPHSSSSSPSFAGPVPSPRRLITPNRTVSPLRPPSPRTVLNHSQVTSKSPHNIVRPLPNRPPSSNSNERYGNVNHHFPANQEQLAPGRRERTRTPSDIRTNLNRSPYQRVANEEQLSTIEHLLDGGNHSRSASLEIEEYDLDRNFPDILRDSNRTDRPSVHTEYKLEPEVNSVPDPEHARLVRLVAVQQDRLKTQESQINQVDTEISSLEEKEKEYEEQLEKLTSELVTLEQRQREEESEITQLETISWHDELISSQKYGQQLQAQISELLEKRQHCEKQITDNKVKETDLSKNISDMKQELEAVDKKLKEDEVKQKSEIEKLKSELASKQKDCDKMEKELQTVDEEIKSLEQTFAEKQKEIEKIEEELKEENIKSLEEPTTSKDNSLQPVKSEKGDGTSILKILEGRLSPRPGTKLNSPQAFINSLSTKNPNGVWV